MLVGTKYNSVACKNILATSSQNLISLVYNWNKHVNKFNIIADQDIPYKQYLLLLLSWLWLHIDLVCDVSFCHWNSIHIVLANSAWQPPKPWRKYLFTMLLSSQVFLLQPMLTYFIIFRYFFIRSSSLCISIVILHFMSQINLSVNKTSLISGSVCTIKYLHLNGTAKFVIHPVCTVWREKHCSLSHKHINFN